MSSEPEELKASVGQWLKSAGYGKAYKAFLKDAKITQEKIEAKSSGPLREAWKMFSRKRGRDEESEESKPKRHKAANDDDDDDDDDDNDDDDEDGDDRPR